MNFTDGTTNYNEKTTIHTTIGSVALITPTFKNSI